jgi:5-bromo-4-chloroindolyl phosphate hydrolysis protein
VVITIVIVVIPIVIVVITIVIVVITIVIVVMIMFIVVVTLVIVDIPIKVTPTEAPGYFKSSATHGSYLGSQRLGRSPVTGRQSGKCWEC